MWKFLPFASSLAALSLYGLVTGDSAWALRFINHFLLIPSPSVFCRYSGLSLEEGYDFLIDVVAQPDLAVTAVMFFIQAASEGFLYTINCDFFIELCVLFLAVRLFPVNVFGGDCWRICHLRRFSLRHGHCFYDLESFAVNWWNGGAVRACRPAARNLHGVWYRLWICYKKCDSIDPRREGVSSDATSQCCCLLFVYSFILDLCAAYCDCTFLLYASAVLLFFVLDSAAFDQNTDVPSDLSGDCMSIVATTENPASKHNDAKGVLAAS